VTVLNSFLLWTTCGTKTTHRPPTSNLSSSALDSKLDSGVSTGDGRFPELQNISINRYVTEKNLTPLNFLHPTIK
jgi:hypothetical protein